MMKKKILLKSIIGILIGIFFMVMCDHMPRLLGGVYSSIFGMVSFPAFLFFVGIFVCELIILRKYVNREWHYYIILGVVFGLSSIILFHGHASLEDKLTPGSNTTLLTRQVAGYSLPEAVFIQYYMGDKKVIVSEEIANHQDDAPYIFTFSVNPHNIRVDEGKTISANEEDILFSFPYFTREEYSFVIDEYWEKTDTLRLVASGEKYIFCSQEILDAIEGKDDHKNIALKNGSCDINAASLIIRDMELARPYKKVKQIIVMSLLFAVGMLIALPIWGKKYPILAVCLSLPISAASLCMLGMVMMLFNISYNIYSIAACCILLVGIWTYKNRNLYKSLEWAELSNYILMAIGVIIVLAYAEICFTTHDSVVKCALGYRLAKYGSLRDILYYAAPYGMLEPMVMSLGYMVHCDLLYTFYPLIIISGLGLMCAGVYYSNKNNKNLSMSVAFGGIILLISNYDFILSAFYVMAHGPIAVYMLLSIMFIILKREINIQGFEYVVILSASMILLSRVEGAVYVLFILIASMGMENEHLRLRKVNIVLAAITILWNGYQIIYIGQSENTLFWTPTRGILLMGASIITVIFTICFNQAWGIWTYIKRNYYGLLSAAIVGGAAFAIVFMERSMASLNMPVYLAHFSNSIDNDTNSAALWIFICLFIPVVLSMRAVIDKYAVTVAFGYLVLVFVICLFRYDGVDQMPLRLGYYDSSRRTIVQIMPTIVWAIAYCMGDAGKEVNKIEKN